MSRTDRMRNDPALKPIGFALAAVVAGLGPAKADVAPGARALPEPSPTPRTAAPTTDAAGRTIYHRDDVLVLNTPADAVPLGEKPAPQSDLFDPDVPLGRSD